MTGFASTYDKTIGIAAVKTNACDVCHRLRYVLLHFYHIVISDSVYNEHNSSIEAR